ncbi:hypothetical protein [Bacillus sp. ZZV12-4809]|nr:hypothetical protein KIS4809_5020 [Bacillus sp. ZZV12-4809]
MACASTGKITQENKRYGKGKIVLSPEGVKILLQEIEKQNNACS